MKNELAYILYSHKDVSFIWEAFIGEQKEYFPFKGNKYFACNEKYNLDDDYETISYSNELKYSDRLIEVLEQIPEDYIMIMHEDMIFYDNVDMSMFEYYFQMLKHNPQFAYLKLLRGGLSQEEPIKFAEGLYYMQKDEYYLFTVQPIIWKKSILLEILKKYPNNTIYDLEANGGKYIAENNILCLFAHNHDDRKKGLYHWENKSFPFIATALIKGKWNDVEYPIEIENLKRMYNLK